jgi:hypothetical protein
MVRWISETKSLKLPKTRIEINLLYTSSAVRYLKDIYEEFFESIKYFDGFDIRRVKIWLATNKEEYHDILQKTLQKKFSLKFFEDISYPSLRLIYGTSEIKDLSPIIIETPTLAVFLPKHVSEEKIIRKAKLSHEIGHVIGINKGYFTPILKAFWETLDNYLFPPFGKVISKVLDKVKKRIDDISADEIVIDRGLEDHLFINYLNETKKLPYEIKTKFNNYLPPEKFYCILDYSSLPIPFKHKGKTKYEESLKSVLSREFKLVRMEETFEEVYSAYDKIKNPPQIEDVKSVFNYVAEKMILLLRR